MNRRFNETTRLLAVLVLTGMTGFVARANDPDESAESFEPCFLEKKRVITKTYSVSPKDRLYVSNQFGEVRIRLWDKPEVRADIVITAYGVTEEEAQDLLEKVEILDERQGDQHEEDRRAGLHGFGPGLTGKPEKPKRPLLRRLPHPPSNAA